MIVEADSYSGSARATAVAPTSTRCSALISAEPVGVPITTTFTADNVARLVAYLRLELYVAGLPAVKASQLAEATHRLALSSLHRGASEGTIRIWNAPDAFDLRGLRRDRRRRPAARSAGPARRRPRRTLAGQSALRSGPDAVDAERHHRAGARLALTATAPLTGAMRRAVTNRYSHSSTVSAGAGVEPAAEVGQRLVEGGHLVLVVRDRLVDRDRRAVDGLEVVAERLR